MSLNGPSQHEQTVIRVYLVNGDARSISFNERNDVTVSLCGLRCRLGFGVKGLFTGRRGVVPKPQAQLHATPGAPKGVS